MKAFTVFCLIVMSLWSCSRTRESPEPSKSAYLVAAAYTRALTRSISASSGEVVEGLAGHKERYEAIAGNLPEEMTSVLAELEQVASAYRGSRSTDLFIRGDELSRKLAVQFASVLSSADLQSIQ